MEDRLLQVRLPIQPGWDAIEPLRVSVQACVRAVFPDAAVASRIALTAAELMENAVKYGDWGTVDGGRFELIVAGADGRVTIEVSNPIDPSGGHFARLKEELEAIARAPSPQEAFMRGVRNVALKRRTSLGLVRIVHEGGCDLAAELSGNVLTVRAVAREMTPPKPTPASAL